MRKIYKKNCQGRAATTVQPHYGPLMGLNQPWRSLLRIAFNYPLAFNYPESFLSAIIIYRMGVSDILVNSHLMTDTALKGAIQPGLLSAWPLCNTDY